MKEIYIDERGSSTGDSPGWGGTGTGGGGGGGGGGGAGGGGGWGGSIGWGGGSGTGITPEWEDKEKFPPERDESALRITAGGALMVDRTGTLIWCCQTCQQLPAIEIKIEGEEEHSPRDHARCIQINLEYTQRRPLYNEPDKTLEYELWPVDMAAPEKVHYAGRFPLPEPGELLTIKAAWQKGHFDIDLISRMSFEICGVRTGKKSIGRNNWRTIATVTLDEWNFISVNGIRGKLPRSREKD